MKRWLILIFVLSMAPGCASHIQWGSTGVNNASDYSITETLSADGKIITRTCVPFHGDRWYSDALDKLGPLFSQLSPVIEKILAYLKVANVPAVIPTPQPSPVPAPVTPTPAPPAPTPTPVPGPTPPPSVLSVFSIEGNLITLDMGTLPGSMRVAGFQSNNDNALYYALAHVYAYGPGKNFVPHVDLDPLNTDAIRGAMFQWFDGAVQTVWDQMQAHSAYEVVAITNDARDRCGFRLGPAIVNRLKEFGQRVSLGAVVPDTDYLPRSLIRKEKAK